MAPTTRRRILRVHQLNWQTEYFVNGTWADAGTGTKTFYDRQLTVSEGTGWPRDRSVRDVGGPFDTIKMLYRNSDGSATFNASYPYSIYPARSKGNNFPHYVWGRHLGVAPFTVENPSDYDVLTWCPSSDDSLTALGSKFIADTIPTNPMLDASVSLAELYREGLPKLLGATLLKSKVGALRGIAGEYLNYQFGWKPIVSDLKAAAKAIIDQESILLQLQRDSGRNVRRKRMLPSEVVINSVGYDSGYPSGIQHTAFDSSWLRTATHLTREQWFSGCYTFYFEPKKMAEVSRIATEARLLYGLTLTPEVVWNLAPWSWLVDWIANVGDVLHNVSAFSEDGLVLRYGYVMEQNSKRVVRSNNVKFNTSTNSSYPTTSNEVFSAVRKMRRKATPYGFGLLESSFTTRQWAILAALGITRAPKSL